MTVRVGVTGDHPERRPRAGSSALEPRRTGHARVRAVDVATAAQVSVSTVSLVVNDKWEGRVAADTVARVRSEVARLGYVVDESARRLATGAAAAVAVVTPAFTNPFYARVALGAAAALGSEYHVLFSVPEIGGDPVAELARLRGLRLAGALVAAPSHELLRVLAPELPTVVLDAPGGAGGSDSTAGGDGGGGGGGGGRPQVDLDVAGGARALGEHLLSLGHRRVAYFRALPERATFSIRREVLRDVLAAEGCELLEPLGFASEVDADAAYRVAAAAIDALDATGVTAVVCATDLHAYGVLRACAAHGIPVPGQWSVAGFDDQPLSAFVSPALTSVSLPAEELGSRAGRLLAQLVAGRASMSRHAAVPATPIVLPVSLAVRDSTGPARARRRSV